jgi:hypothetical protein
VTDFAEGETLPGIFGLATVDLDDAATASAEWGCSQRTPIETATGKRQWRGEGQPR